MAKKNPRQVHQVTYSKLLKRWVVSRGPYRIDPPAGMDQFLRKKDAAAYCGQMISRDRARREIERKVASREKIVRGIQSLDADDLINLRDWVVALMQLGSH